MKRQVMMKVMRINQVKVIARMKRIKEPSAKSSKRFETDVKTQERRGKDLKDKVNHETKGGSRQALLTKRRMMVKMLPLEGTAL